MALAATAVLVSGIAAAELFQPAALRPAPASPGGLPRAALSGELAFEPDAGRTGDGARFLARARAMTLVVRDNGSEVSVGRERPAVVRTTLVGAAPSHVVPSRRLPGVVNSYVGGPANWRSGLPTFAGVRSAGVYPGIDLAYRGRGGRLEYDFSLAPGADPDRIAMQIAGARGLRLDRHGDLLIRTRAGTLRQRRPVALQDGRRVDAGFRLDGRRLGFRLGGYDRTRPLLIDPVLSYSTYLGGSGSDYGSGVSIDGAGNLYAAGGTDSADFPGANAASGNNAFLTKLAPDGKSRMYSTYFGGSGLDNASGVDVDAQGNAYIGGTTESADLPGRASGVQSSLNGTGDGYVAKFDSSGALVGSTYLGGSGNDFVFGIAVDPAGSSYVTGQTLSNDFPTSVGAMQPSKGSGGTTADAFITKFPTGLGSRTYSTYLGGSLADYGNSIAVGPDGSPYLTGITYSANFPLTNAMDPVFYTGNPPGPPPINATEAFVTRLAPDGASRVYSTYIGGDGFEQGNGIAVDGQGYAYITGDTGSSAGLGPNPPGNFPYSGPPGQTNNAGGNDALIAKLTAAGVQTFIGWYGGSLGDSGQAAAFDGQGNAYFTGRTGSSNLVVTANVPQAANANPATDDAWVLKVGNGVTAGSELVYATYLGGTAFDAGRGIVVDQFGAAYLGGETVSDGFPVTAGVAQPDSGGGTDAWLAKLSISPVVIQSGPDGKLRSRTAAFTYSSLETNATYRCRLSPVEASFSGCAKAGKSYAGLADGTYRFEVSATDSAGTTSAAAARDFFVDTSPIAHFDIAPNPALAGRTVTFDASGSSGAEQALVKYEWDIDGDGKFERDTGATPSTTEVFSTPRVVTVALRVTDAAGATATSSSELHVNALGSGGQFGVTINKGAQYTNTPAVTITSNFPSGTTSLLFSNDGGFLAPTQFAPPKATTNWKLDSSGPERLPKIVYVRFLTGSIVSETHTDDIILDETPPKVQQASVAPAAPAAARAALSARLRTWKVKVKASDSNSGVSRVQVTASKRKPGKLLRYKRKLKVKSAKRPRWVRARDRAGNYSKWRKAR